MPVISNRWFPSRQQALVWLSQDAKQFLRQGETLAQIARRWREAEHPHLLGSPWDTGSVQRCLTFAETITNQGEFPGTLTTNLGG